MMRRMTGGLVTGSHDGDGACGVVQHLPAHGAEQQALEAADTSGADDEQGRTVGRLEKRSRRQVTDELKGDARIGANCTAYQLGECRLGIRLVIIRVERLVRFHIALGDVAPGHHGCDRLVADGVILDGTKRSACVAFGDSSTPMMMPSMTSTLLPVAAADQGQTAQSNCRRSPVGWRSWQGRHAMPMGPTALSPRASAWDDQSMTKPRAHPSDVGVRGCLPPHSPGSDPLVGASSVRDVA